MERNNKKPSVTKSNSVSSITIKNGNLILDDGAKVFNAKGGDSIEVWYDGSGHLNVLSVLKT